MNDFLICLLGSITLPSSIFLFSELNTYLSNIMKNNKLYKLIIDNNMQIIDYNSILKRSEKLNTYSYENIDFYQMELLISLIHGLNNYISEENMQSFYQNVGTLKIIYDPSLIKTKQALGIYYPLINTIVYARERNLPHEFLHMSSTVVDKDNTIVLTGFKSPITDNNGSRIFIGNGLNEGYTEVLAKRLYYEKYKPCLAYHECTKIAELIELFFDHPMDMVHLYFNHDLYGLVKYLEKFAPREEVIKMILEIDQTLYNTIIPFPIINSIKIQLKLYEWFSAKISDPNRLQQFRTIIGKNPIITITLSAKNITLSRNQSYEKCKPIFENQKEKSIEDWILSGKNEKKLSKRIIDHSKPF